MKVTSLLDFRLMTSKNNPTFKKGKIKRTNRCMLSSNNGEYCYHCY